MASLFDRISERAREEKSKGAKMRERDRQTRERRRIISKKEERA